MHLYCPIFHFSLFALNSDAYYAKIIPYDDETMRISVVTTDENGMAAGKAFKDVQLINGTGFEYAMADHGSEGQITILEKDL